MAKDKLKFSKIKVIQADGSTFIEDSKGQTKTKVSNTEYGFVVDTKPDSIPAEVANNLFIGSQDCVDVKIIHKYNIKYILSIGIPLPNIDFTCLSYEISSKYILCLDLPETKLSEICKESNLFIKSSLKNNDGAVLVHCNAGVSRSVSVIIGYLMLELHYNFDDAYKLVKNVRPCCQPNIGFINQLKHLK